MGNRKSTPSESRTIKVGENSKAYKKKSNKIKTSKYSLLTFLPKNLLEQFRRVANFYFLIVTIIGFFIDSPVSPYTTLLPLVFVVLVTAVKQGYEDWLRHRADNAVNNEPVTVIRKSILSTIKSNEIKPGELVKVGRNQDVPVDMVLLVSSDSRAKCFITTANLDGETNLKTIRVPAPLVGLSVERLPKDISIECMEPISDLYTFHGRLVTTAGADAAPLNIENLMLRGSRVKNTEWAIGCAVYTGEDTKLALNSSFTSNKFTSIESSINKFLILFIGVLLAEMIVSFFLKRYLETQRSEHQIYLGPINTDNSIRSIAQDMFSFLLIYYYLIPISLYVTIEFQKFLGSLYINWDEDLRCKITDQRAIANTSDLNEELGQIEILFSDKTGTLTKNIMFFQMCSVNGVVYAEKGGRLLKMDDWTEGDYSNKIDIKMFLTMLATCHSVQIEEESEVPLKNGMLHAFIMNNNQSAQCPAIPRYQSSSSDEKALVEAAALFGVTFLGDDNNRLTVNMNDGTVEVYERLQVLEFTPERKRMSVILKDKFGKIWLYCKGAESSVLPLCIDDPMIRVTDHHVQQFANKGLRTLVVAYRELTATEYDAFHKDISRLKVQHIGRASLAGQSDSYRGVETGLTLIGATAVEDQLQDDVEETLVSLREAGIQIWVLTGDKVETAMNVAQSCGHIPLITEKMFLTDIRSREYLRAQLDEYLTCSAGEGHYTLVVDGSSIAFALGNEYENDFSILALRCESVICCRLSPLQKSQIVALIKRSPTKPITGAIGDGANDISMIQEANVGFGIFGREGRQAARSADFAFTNFSMLRKLLIVHGHWYYQRLATLVQFFFYKNMAFVNLMIFFQIQSDFSTQSIFDSVFLSLHNLLFTSIPCTVLSLSEQCHSPRELLRNPKLYSKHRRNKLLSWPYFLGWCFLGVIHSVVIYFFLYALWNGPVINMDGKSTGLWCFGVALYHCLVVVVNLKIWLVGKYQTAIFIISVIVSILAWIGISALYSSIHIQYDGDVLGTFTKLLASPSFWFVTFLISVTALLPDWLFKAAKIIRTPPLLNRRISIEITEL